MPGLLLKNIPPELHEKLRERAKLNRRSMSAEALVILEMALACRRRPTLEEIDRKRIRLDPPLTEEEIDRAKKMGRR